MQGAGSGIGLQTVKVFLAAGAKGVALVDLNKKALQEAHTELERDYAGKLLLIAGDVSAEDATNDYVDQTMDKWGHLDVRRMPLRIWLFL